MLEVVLDSLQCHNSPFGEICPLQLFLVENVDGIVAADLASVLGLKGPLYYRIQTLTEKAKSDEDICKKLNERQVDWSQIVRMGILAVFVYISSNICFMISLKRPMGLSSPELVTYSILYAVIPSSAMDMTVHGTFEILFFVKMLFLAAKILSTLRLIYASSVAVVLLLSGILCGFRPTIDIAATVVLFTLCPLVLGSNFISRWLTYPIWPICIWCVGYPVYMVLESFVPTDSGAYRQTLSAIVAIAGCVEIKKIVVVMGTWMLLGIMENFLDNRPVDVAVWQILSGRKI